MANGYGGLDSVFALYRLLVKYANFWGASRLYLDRKDTSRLLLHPRRHKHLLAYYGLLSTATITAIIIAQISHSLCTDPVGVEGQLRSPAFMLQALFALINCILIRVQYIFVVHPEDTATTLRLVFGFLLAFERRHECQLQFPVRTIKCMLVILLCLQSLAIAGFLIDCELIVGSFMPVCQGQNQVPLVHWIWINFPCLSWPTLFFSFIYVTSQFYCTMLLSVLLMMATAVGIRAVLILNQARTLSSSDPNSESALQTWAVEQFQIRVVCKIYNEFLDPVKVFTITFITCYNILLFYALIEVRYNAAMTVYMGLGALGVTATLEIFSRIIYSAHHISAEELEFRRRQAPATDKYWQAYVRACRPWQVHIGSFCTNYSRDSNTNLWRTGGDNLMNLLLSF